MITLIVLVLIAITGLGFVFVPVWQGVRRPWTLQTPDGDEEALQQERFTALEALRDLAMDFKLGNLDETDYRALAAPLQQRARRVLDLQKKRNRTTTLTNGPQQGHGVVIDAEMDVWLEAQILAARRVVPGETTTNQVRFCPHCGSAVVPEYRFCASCGTRLPLVENRNSPRNNGQPSESHEETVIPPQPVPLDAVPAEKRAERMGQDPQSVADKADSTIDETAAPVAIATESMDSHPPAWHQWWGALTNSRRWLWGLGALVTLLWAAGVIWIYVSAKSGQTNQTPIAVLPNVPIQALAASDNLLVLGEPKGIRTSSNGQQWMPLPVAGDMHSIARVADDAWVAVGSGSLWRSEDSALTWELMEIAPADLSLVAIAAVPGQSALLWGVDATTLYRSEDGGRSWRNVSVFQLGRPQALAAGTAQLFVGADQGVFQSGDSGQSWTNLNGVMNSAIISTDIQALAYDEQNELLYAGTEYGVSFQKLQSFGGWGQRTLRSNVTALALDGTENQVMWVGTADGKIYRSNDRGVTWQ